MRYYSFNTYLRSKYGERVHRLSLDAGFTCPTRDGTLDRKGCIYCNEKGFSPFAGKKASLREQIEMSIVSAREKYKAEKYIAYFQNASGTYAPVSELRRAYDIVKDFPSVVGLFISTRPDCVDDEKLDLIQSYTDDYEVWIEYGLQTIHDETLDFINRGHTFSQSVQAIKKTAEKGIKAAAHVILGLPGETREDMIDTARAIAGLPISGVKMHALHVLKNTMLENLYRDGKTDLLTRDEYVKTACDFLENLRPDCVIFRLVSDARKEFLVAPEWINDKGKVISRIEKELEARDSRQGAALSPYE
jgi:radical SAM protein (TIGR01212 family)